MKKFRQILSLLSCILVFVSSSSFSFGLHHCGGEVRDIAFLDHADGCGHQQLPPCHRLLMAGCCSDETLSYHAQGFDAHQSIASISSPVQVFLHTFMPIDEIISSPYSTIKKGFTGFDPPLRPSALILNCVFRI